MKMGKKAKKETFEDALDRLEEIAEKLEHGDMPLDESLKSYEEGVRAYRRCSELLKQVEKKIEILTRKEDGLKADDAEDLAPPE